MSTNELLPALVEQLRQSSAVHNTHEASDDLADANRAAVLKEADDGFGFGRLNQIRRGDCERADLVSKAVRHGPTSGPGIANQREVWSVSTPSYICTCRHRQPGRKIVGLLPQRL